MKSTMKSRGIRYGKKSLATAEDFDPKNIKERITIFVDQDIVDEFRKRSTEIPGAKYQTLINDALRAHIGSTESVVARLKKLEAAVFKKHG